MPSTTALFTAMTGLNAASRSIDVIGHNIANANTTAFKSSRLLFSTMFSRTLSGGTPPGDVTGGTNPFQIGMGVATAGTQRNTTSGTITGTGDQRDLAIDGGGFFVVRRGDDQLYTRAGAFRNNARNELTTISGEVLRGFGVDANFNVVPGVLTDISIPIGGLTIAEPTRNVRFSGNLDADGPLPSQGAAIALTGTATAGLIAIASASPAPGAGNRVEATTRLVDIEAPSLPGSNTPLFAAGQTIELRGAERGSRAVPAASLAISSTTTLADLASFLSDALGIQTSTGANPDGMTPGVSIDPVTGSINIIGNTGSVNDLSVEASDLRLLDSSGTLLSSPLVPAKSKTADGESVRTTFIVYDSLGAPVTVDLTLALESRGNTGTTWRYYAESPDSTGIATQLATGTLDFDTAGQPLFTTPVSANIDRSGTGADSPLSIALAFTSADDSGVTSLSDASSSIAATFRDGSPIGTLTAFAVGSDGTIVGAFTNGLTRTLGQVAIATFSNEAGLEDVGGNMFRVSGNSGNAILASPGSLSAGRVVGGALEQSNVDLSEEFIKLVLSSTGFSANARVIRTTDELMQQLMVLGR
jgi:flagellar hook protein FlgE